MELIIGMMVLMVLFMWWSGRKQKKQAAEMQSFLDSLAPGTRVMTGAGYIGSVVSVEGDEVTLESEPGGGRTVWLKAAIRKEAPLPTLEATPVDENDDDVPDVEVPDYVSKLIDKPATSESTVKRDESTEK